MSVIVPDGMPVEQALKLLWREAIRENIPNVIQANQYRIKPAFKRHELKKLWEKTKRRSRSAKRNKRRKGILRDF